MSRLTSSGFSCCVQWPESLIRAFSRSEMTVLHAVGHGRRQDHVLLGHDHQAGDAIDPGRQVGRALPVAGEVPIPVDPAGEAGAPRSSPRRPRAPRASGAGWRRRTCPKPSAPPRRRRSSRPRAARRLRAWAPASAIAARLAHEEPHGLVDVRGQGRVGLARLLEPDDVHVLAERGAHAGDGVDGRARAGKAC